ncbi:MAG TPA: argininosuccinate lyase [Firmicutes bacterium]|nr:argininosuccinate lyase [Bacillota bacterium]
MKLWGGRFTRPTDTRVDDFHSSIGFDWQLYRYDIMGSQAHARGLARARVITEADADLIVEGLEQILTDIEAGKLPFSVEAEDIHMNIEAELIARIGEPGRRLHTGRSRNDQVAVDTRLYLKDQLSKIEGMILELQQALVEQAEATKNYIMPGFTHLQPAQPILAAHHFLAYVEMFQRDRERLADCYKRVDVCPLGAGALAGVTYPIDREWVAQQLGFSAVTANSLDAVSARDYLIEFISAAGILMMHISRLCEEIILWATPAFNFIELDDAFSTGSSIMPQKKNPDVAELARGKTGRVVGHLVGLLTMMKGLPLAYNKDMQEDKEAMFDTVHTCVGVLGVMTPMIRSMQVKPERMENACVEGFLTATDLADYLVRKGVPFRSAHEIVGKIVLYCTENQLTLADLSTAELRRFAPEADDDVQETISLQASVNARMVIGGTAPAAVENALSRARKLVADRLLRGAN